MKEVVTQKQENKKKRRNWDKDPGDDEGRHRNYSKDLEKHLGHKDKREH